VERKKTFWCMIGLKGILAKSVVEINSVIFFLAGLETKAAILKTMNLFDTVLLILTLCFHSVFDGLAVGVTG
jgi:hypothetical protein